MLPLKHDFILVEQEQDYAKTAAHTLAAIIGVDKSRPFLTSLSGGTTPFPVYRCLAPLLAGNGRGENCYWMQTDERMVSPDNQRSNQRGIKESLMATGLLPQSSFFPVLIDEPSAAEIEDNFERLCHDYHDRLLLLPAPVRPPAPIDLLILGIGTDGHTASLFPGTDWQTRRSASGFAVFKTPDQPEPRFSLTLERILQARKIVILVNGQSKQQIIQKLLFEPDFICPAGYIASQRRLTWIIDYAAAGAILSEQIRQTMGHS